MVHGTVWRQDGFVKLWGFFSGTVEQRFPVTEDSGN